MSNRTSPPKEDRANTKTFHGGHGRFDANPAGDFAVTIHCKFKPTPTHKNPMSKIAALKAAQAALKDHYRANPEAALLTLSAEGRVDFENLAVEIARPAFLNPAGLHPSGGGDGTFSCPVEIMLAGLVSCAGVTLAAVATSMKLPLRGATVRAEGDLDFRGTLAVDRAAPVGLTAMRLIFTLDLGAPQESIDKLIELTHRYCVVHRTLGEAVQVEVKLS
jgi:uncharacterized OsmC-like protein